MNKMMYKKINVNKVLYKRLTTTNFNSKSMIFLYYIRLPTTCLNIVASTLVPASSFDSLVLGTMGVLTALQFSIPNRDSTS